MLSEFIEYSMYFSKYIYAKRFKLKWVEKKKKRKERIIIDGNKTYVRDIYKKFIIAASNEATEITK